MSMLVLVCGNVFDGLSAALSGPAEILVEGNRITKVERSVGRPPGAQVIDLSERTVSPGFIDTHVHLTMDAASLARQTLQSSAAKAQESPHFENGPISRLFGPHTGRTESPKVPH